VSVGSVREGRGRSRECIEVVPYRVAPSLCLCLNYLNFYGQGDDCGGGWGSGMWP